MIRSLLIANRGEIACRIIRTARSLGIRTVAVYSDADTKALHVRQADEAVHIGASPARESYLVGEKIIAAALATKAEAIHPGYGFLSENAAFAQAVINAGLIWVGPAPASITAMGLKDAAKTLMAAAGVPVTPGYMGENQEPDFLAARAAEIGYPVLIKAVAGGGGKGMRKVEDATDFADALASCQREATASFGNAHVLIEKYIQRPRHIEVQIFGDTHGNIVHLFERDCSLQRRHQKVIEEAPAPGMDEATRAELCAVAVKAAKAVNYVGAGTIEFIADASEGLRADRIWFMEMNTRLQVEHPVTEEITGVDLVEWQLRVASGEPLPKRQDELSINGWAMEARLYAEDPAKGFLPSVGRLERWECDYDFARIDSGIAEGDSVGTHYDPMIAKIIFHSDTRDITIMNLCIALANTVVFPLKTNLSFLYEALDSQEFRSGQVHTGLLSDIANSLIIDNAPSEMDLQRVAWTIVNEQQMTGMMWADPRFGFRLNSAPNRDVAIAWNGKRLVAELPTTYPVYSRDEPRISSWHYGTEDVRNIRGQIAQCTAWRAEKGREAAASSGTILSPMPGRIIAVEVTQGQTVAKGQKLLTLEAMKMEHSLTAPFDGLVTELNAAAGAQVQVEAVLARIEAVV